MENGKLKGSAGGMVCGAKSHKVFTPQETRIFGVGVRDNVGTHRMRPIIFREKTQDY